MAPIKITYFDVPAMGEAVRLALAQSGVEWEDNRIKLQDWPALKPTTPYGQLPLMEVDGRVIPQSYAQLRYVGKIGDLYPTDPIQAAYCDAAADAVMDIHTPMRASLSEKDKEKKMEMRKDLAENLIPTWLANVEKLSIGDIAIVARLNWLRAGVLDGIPSTIVDGSPLLSSLVERVMAEPRIAAYMETRPKK